MKTTLIRFAIFAALIMALAASALAQSAPYGLNVVVDTRGTFSTLGHYRLSYVDPIPALGIRFQTEAWVLGGAVGGAGSFGGAWVGRRQLNSQIGIYAGLEGRFVAGEKPAGGIILGLDFTPRAEASPSAVRLTIISEAPRHARAWFGAGTLSRVRG